jgi:cell wall-associated NlpC family hydrolase
VTDRATGRHRAPERATTPLSTLGTSLTNTVSGHVTGIGRSGAIIAMSSGLVASMGMPAGAVTRDAPDSSVLPRSATLGATLGSADLATVSASFASGDPLSAPATATLTFDRSTITANPAPKAVPIAHVSRSAARTALGTGGGVSTRTLTGGSYGSARGSSAIAVAARYLGVAYRSGGTTPNGFDCSGYVRYVFNQLGVSLPRTADEQYNAATRIPSSAAEAGDLVFFLSGGSAYHVGIYAGNGMMYDAGRTGEVITKRAIWSADIAFGWI